MLAFLGTLGVPELLLVGGVIVLFFGARKLPEMARGMGQAITELRRGVREDAGGTDASATPDRPGAGPPENGNGG